MNMKKRALNLLQITIASFIYGAGIGLFLDPNNLAPGGVTGLAIIGNRISGVGTGTLLFILNIPLLILGVWKLGGKTILLTAYALVLISVSTELFHCIRPFTTDLFLSAITGGTMVAAALGTIFKAGGTTGGTDIIIRILRSRYPHLRTGFLFMISDILIVAASGFVFQKPELMLYAAFTVFVMSKILDLVLYGGEGARMVFIISACPDAIGKRIMNEIIRGITYLKGEGGYSMEKKKLILCVVKKQQVPKVEAIVKEEDPRAFLIITGATQIYGEGYQNLFAEKL